MNVFDLQATLGLDTSKFESALSRAQGGIKNSGIGAAAVAVGKMAADGIEKAGSAILNFGKTSIQTGANFDTAMAQVAATMGKTVDQISTEQASATVRGKEFTGNLRDYAKFVGETTEYSATQAADALNYMALAGYDTQQSMNMLPNVLNLASAGAMDMAKASDMVTDAQSALGLTMTQTSNMVDQMAKTASTTNTNVEQLGEAFLTVGGTARSMKGGTAELAQVLGILADNGIKGAEGGTHLRNIILSLSKPTDKAAMYLDKFGVSLYDAEGNMRSMSDVMLDLNDAMSGLTDQEKTEAIATIFNKTDLKAVNALLGTSADRWSEVAEAIANSTYNLDDINNALENSGVNWDRYSDKLGSTKDEIASSFDGMTDMIIKMTGEEKSNEEIVGALAATYGLSMGDAKTAVDSVTTAMKQATGAAEEMANTQIDNLNGDMTLFQSALEAVQIAISDKVTPALREFVKMGTQGLSDLSAAINNGDWNAATDAIVNTISSAVDKASEYLPAIMDVGGKIVGAVVSGIVRNIPSLITAATNLILQFANYITENADAILQNMGAIVAAIGNGIITNLPALVTAAVNLLQAFSQYLSDNSAQIATGAAMILQALADAFITLAPVLITTAAQIISTLAQGMSESLPVIIPAVVELIGAIGKALIDNLPLLLEAGGQIVLGLVEGIREALPGWAQPVAAGVVAAFGFAKIAPLISQTVLPALSSFGSGIGSVVEMLSVMKITSGSTLGALKTLLSTVLSGVSPFTLIAGAIGAVIAIGVLLYKNWDTIKEKAQELWAKINEAFPAIGVIVNTVFTAIQALWENVLQPVFQAIGDFVQNILWPVIQVVFMAIQEIVGAVFAYIKGYWENILSPTFVAIGAAVKFLYGSVFKPTFDLISDVVETVFDAIKGFWDSILEPVFEAIGKAADKMFEAVKGPLDSLKKKFETIFNGIKSFLSPVIEWLKGIFNFEWHLPQIKLPHFKVEGNFSLNPPSVPHFNVDWYKKAMNNAMLLNSPTIFGAAGGNLLGAGEAGSEVVAGANTLMGMIRQAVKETIPASAGFVQNLTVNSPEALTPSEVARQTRNATQSVLLAMRVGA